MCSKGLDRNNSYRNQILQNSSTIPPFQRRPKVVALLVKQRERVKRLIKVKSRVEPNSFPACVVMLE
jgi:hypothetical protein